MARFDARAFVNDLVTSMNARDPERFLAHYAENAELKDPSVRQPVRGKDGIRKNFETWSNAFSEMQVDIRHVIESPEGVAVQYDITGRHTGELELSPGEMIPPTNKSAKVEIGEFLKLDQSGRIVSDTTIFDVASLMQQLGLMPSPEAAGRGEPPRQPRAR